MRFGLDTAVAPHWQRLPTWDLSMTRLESQSGAPLVDWRQADDRALVAAFIEGHREAFDEIVERHRRNIYQLCYRFVNNHEDASDLGARRVRARVQGPGNFKNESSLGTWLYRVGVNACLNRVATKKVETEPIDAAPRVDGRARRSRSTR